MTEEEAQRLVGEASLLYERGEMPFTNYDRMRTALVNRQFGIIRKYWDMYNPGDKVIEHREDLERERDQLLDDNARLEAENAALCESVTAYKQTAAAALEVNAALRAIARAVADGVVMTGGDLANFLLIGAGTEGYLWRDKARALLAAHGEEVASPLMRDPRLMERDRAAMAMAQVAVNSATMTYSKDWDLQLVLQEAKAYLATWFGEETR